MICVIRRYLMNVNAGYPLVLYGPPGSGKTTVIAAVAKHSHLWNQDAAVVVRFASASAYSSSLEQTLNSLVVQLNLLDSGKCSWFKHVSIVYETLKYFCKSFHVIVFRMYNHILINYYNFWGRLEPNGR